MRGGKTKYPEMLTCHLQSSSLTGDSSSPPLRPTDQLHTFLILFIAGMKFDFCHAFCRIQNTFVLCWVWGKGVSLLSRYAKSMYYKLGSPPHPGCKEPFVAAWSHSSGTCWTYQAGHSGSVCIAACCWRSICSCRVEVPSESSKNWVWRNQNEWEFKWNSNFPLLSAWHELSEFWVLYYKT